MRYARVSNYPPGRPALRTEMAATAHAGHSVLTRFWIHGSWRPQAGRACSPTTVLRLMTQLEGQNRNEAQLQLVGHDPNQFRSRSVSLAIAEGTP